MLVPSRTSSGDPNVVSVPHGVRGMGGSGGQEREVSTSRMVGVEEGGEEGVEGRGIGQGEGEGEVREREREREREESQRCVWMKRMKWSGRTTSVRRKKEGGGR